LAIWFSFSPRAMGWRRVAESIKRLFSENGWEVYYGDVLAGLFSFRGYDRGIHIETADWVSFSRTGAYRFYTPHLTCYYVAEGKPLWGSCIQTTQEAYISRIATPSEFSKRCMEEVGINVDAVVPHGIVLEEFQNPDMGKVHAIKNRFKGKKTVFVNCFNDLRKGLDFLIESWSQVVKKVEDAVLLLNTSPAGFYNIPSLIERSAKKHGIHNLGEKVITLRGDAPLPFEEILAHYWTCDFLLQPSLSEGFGLPVVEAFACGKPVLALDAFGVNELITDESDGILVETTETKEIKGPFGRNFYLRIPNLKDYVEKTIMLLEDERLRRELGEKAKETAKRYSYKETYRYFLL